MARQPFPSHVQLGMVALMGDSGREVRGVLASLVLVSACASSARQATDATEPIVVEVRVDPEGAPASSEAGGDAPPIFDRSAFLLLPPDLNRRQPAAKLACEPKLERRDERLSVAVAGSEVTLPSETIRFPSSGELNVLPYNGNGVLLSYHTPAYPTLQTHSVVFWLECSGAHRLFVALVAEQAELGRALLGAQGRWLYYPDALGLQRLDLDTLHTREPQSELRVANRPEYRPSCWGGTEIEKPYLFPEAWLEPEKRLSALIFAPCGFEGDPEAQRATLVDLDTAAPRVIRHSPVAAVVADKQGTLWVGDGGEFESPGVTDPATTGFVWTSADAGETWLPVDLGSTGPVGQLATRGNTLIALESRRSSVIETGGDLHLSRDGGRTWRELPLDPAALPKDADANGLLFDQFDVVGWSPLQLVVWRRVNDEEQVFETTLTPQLEQGGREVVAGTLWKRVDARPRPARGDQLARIGEWQFRATKDGLLRGGPAGEAIVFRTVDHWRATDWQGIVDDASTGTTVSDTPGASTAPSPWRWGCRSGAEVMTTADRGKQWLGVPLAVRGVARGDVLHLRRAASPQARIVRDLSPMERGISATGNICKYDQSYWVQVRVGEHAGWANGRYLDATSSPSGHEVTP